jgi:putative glutamine amidotransferase
MPTLAICRGMQLAVVVEGGRLHQDIGEPGTLHEPISDDPDQVLGARHPVTILPGSRLADVFGAGQREVNTIHHQAVADLPPSLRVTATAPDGVIEAVEPTTPGWPLLAVQWHPEKLAGADRPLFDAFVRLAAEFAAQRASVKVGA